MHATGIIAPVFFALVFIAVALAVSYAWVHAVLPLMVAAGMANVCLVLAVRNNPNVFDVFLGAILAALIAIMYVALMVRIQDRRERPHREEDIENQRRYAANSRKEEAV